MREIHVEEDLRLRFPGRGEEFDQGVEIGLLIAAMASGQTELSLRIAAANLDQAQALATRMGYRVRVEARDTFWADISCCTGRIRPKLTLVRTGSTMTAYAPAGC
jgi:hypothetical protein